MLDAIKPLLESGLINEDVSNEISKVWESKLTEARDQVRAELREEFAQRYEHDRTVMVEALDKMMTENLATEIAEFHEERKAFNEDRVKAKVQLQEQASKFNDFLVTKLAEEIRELRNDRKVYMENQHKLEQFVVHALAREIKEFTQDKQAVVEARVKLVAEGREKLEALKQKFVAESAVRVKSLVASHLAGELSQLKEDIKSARENNFGRKLFEAFASEYSVTYLNDKAEARKLMKAMEEKEKALAEAAKVAQEAIAVAESKDREVRIIKESTQREKEMEKLLSPLNKEKAEIMKALLESVQTPKLKSAFDKYLPAVLNTGSPKAGAKTALTESVIKEVTGDKETAKKEVETDPVVENNLIDFKRLAGLK
jgi:hypothetical protein